MSNITLNSLVYTGNGILNGVASFINRTAGLVTGFRVLSSRVTYNDKTLVAWKMQKPELVAEDSECGCAGALKYTNHFDIQVRLDKRATAAERAAILKDIQDLVLTTQFSESVTSLVNPT